MDNYVLNLDDPAAKRTLIEHCRALAGRWRIKFVRYRPRRTDRQNKYYWPCFVEPLSRWLAEQWGETVSPDHAHEILKHKFLRVPMVSQETGIVLCDDDGEPLMRTRSTTELTTTEFNEYLDRIAQWLLDHCGIEVPKPGEYREVDDGLEVESDEE